MADANGEVLDLAGAAALLRVPEEAVRREAVAGRLPGRDIGGEWRFARAAVLDWLGRPDDGPTRSGVSLAAHIRNVIAHTGFRESEAEAEAFLARVKAQRKGKTNRPAGAK